MAKRNHAKEIGVAKEPIVDAFDWECWRKHAENYLTPDGYSVTLLPLIKLNVVKQWQTLKEDFFKLMKAELKKLIFRRTFLEYVFDEVIEAIITDEAFKGVSELIIEI